MFKTFERSVVSVVTAVTLVFGAGPVLGADHGDAPSIASDRGGDNNDCYAFLDPNDNRRVVLAFTTHGFIAPGEGVNFGVFDPNLRYRIDIENTGDADPDIFITTTFSNRVSPMEPQVARVELPNGSHFFARATNPSLAGTAPNQKVKEDAASGARYFAGQVDDPFFFDIPAFSRFIASARAGAPDVTVFNRGRDSFAGYNTLAQAISLPASAVSNGATSIGVQCVTLRATETPKPNGTTQRKGSFRQIDRSAVPAVNVVLIPFPRKDLHNGSTPVQDAAGRFNADITATMNLLGTNPATQAAILDIVANNGDLMRLDLRVANSGPGGGNNAGAGFPNGRRIGDDVVDTLLFLLSNEGITEGDNVDASDVPLRNRFPFFGFSQQPRAPGVIDDNTRS